VFSAFLSRRAAPATPGERDGALVEPFPSRAAFAHSPRGSASPLIDEATSGFAVRCGPSLRSHGLQPTAFRPRFCWKPRDLTQGTWLPTSRLLVG
jgi:hypothetical protein